MSSKRGSTGSKVLARPKRQAAFISAPFAVDTSVVVNALKERGLEAIRIDEMGIGQNISEWIRQSIGRSDYVIAVLGEKPNGNVLFELGVAAGMGKQVLILAPQHGEFPLAATGLSYLKAGPNNREAIEFGLDQLLAAPKTRASPQFPGDRETHAIGDSADRLLEGLQAVREAGVVRESQLIDLIAEAIRESGVSALSRGSRGEGGASRTSPSGPTTWSRGSATLSSSR